MWFNVFLSVKTWKFLQCSLRRYRRGGKDRRNLAGVEWYADFAIEKQTRRQPEVRLESTALKEKREFRRKSGPTELLEAAETRSGRGRESLVIARNS